MPWRVWRAHGAVLKLYLWRRETEADGAGGHSGVLGWAGLQGGLGGLRSGKLSSFSYFFVLQKIDLGRKERGS